MNYQYAKQHGWISDALCQVKETTLKKLHNMWLHLHKILEKAKNGDRNKPNDCQGLRVGRCWLQRSMRKLLRAAECSVSWFWGVRTKLKAFVHKLCHNKTDLERGKKRGSVFISEQSSKKEKNPLKKQEPINVFPIIDVFLNQKMTRVIQRESWMKTLTDSTSNWLIREHRLLDNLYTIFG